MKRLLIAAVLLLAGCLSVTVELPPPGTKTTTSQPQVASAPPLFEPAKPAKPVAKEQMATPGATRPTPDPNAKPKPQGAPKTIGFDEDFEGSFPPVGWSFTYLTGSMAQSTDTALTGTHSMKMVYPYNDGSSSTTLTAANTPWTTTNGFWRFAIKVMPGFTTGCNNLSKVNLLPYSGYSTFEFEGGGCNPPATSACPNGWGGVPTNVGCTPTAPVTFRLQLYAYDCGIGHGGTGSIPSDIPSFNVTADGQWHQIEANYQLNTPGSSNGSYTVWVDNAATPAWSSTGRQIVGPATNSTDSCGNGYPTPSNQTFQGIQYYQQSGNGTIYIDRTAFADQRIGFVGAAPPLTPNAPTNLNLTRLMRRTWQALVR